MKKLEEPEKYATINEIDITIDETERRQQMKTQRGDAKTLVTHLLYETLETRELSRRRAAI